MISIGVPRVGRLFGQKIGLSHSLEVKLAPGAPLRRSLRNVERRLEAMPRRGPYKYSYCSRGMN